MPAAARLADEISHSNKLGGLVAGALIGAAVGLAVVSTGGLAAVAIVAGAAVGGAAVGELIGSLSFSMEVTGAIAEPCSANVFVNSRPAARAHIDFVDCDRHSAHPVIAQGSGSVFINGQPAARKGDHTACDAVISMASDNVFIGGETVTTDEISPEVPAYVHTAMLVVGLASAAILAGPVVAAVGLVGGMAGGALGNLAGGALFGEGSDGQKLMAFGGGLLGGLAGAKGGAWFERNYEVQSQGLGSNFGNLKVVPKSSAARAAAKGFPDVGTTKNGGPTFKDTDYLYPTAEGQKNVVDVELTGSRRGDFKAANEAAGLDETPDGYTWHHVDDYDPSTGKSSLELVQSDAHRATYPHSGSVAQYEQANDVKYKR